jgi:hypothetical protein
MAIPICTFFSITFLSLGLDENLVSVLTRRQQAARAVQLRRAQPAPLDIREIKLLGPGTAI